MKNIVLSVLFLLQFSVHAFAQSQYDVERQRELVKSFDISESWKAVKVFVPDESNSISIDKLINKNPKNVVIYLHGCGGIGADELNWAKYLKDNGYFVALPDSLAIPNRKRNCEPGSSKRNAHNVPVGPLRVLEARYAFDQISKIASVENIFLMGHSEGGAVILMTPLMKFSAVVSIGSFCSGPKVNVSKEVPLLLINYEFDPWFKDIVNLCQDKTSHRNENTKLIILSGLGHEASTNQEARNSVLEFLKKNSK
jgi:dienelactone hydrolase